MAIRRILRRWQQMSINASSLLTPSTYALINGLPTGDIELARWTRETDVDARHDMMTFAHVVWFDCDRGSEVRWAAGGARAKRLRQTSNRLCKAACHGNGRQSPHCCTILPTSNIATLGSQMML